MDKLKISCPCLFGLESVLSGEMKRMGAENIVAEDGRVTFEGSFEDAARANHSRGIYRAQLRGAVPRDACRTMGGIYRAQGCVPGKGQNGKKSALQYVGLPVDYKKGGCEAP